jgi:hypothetical protein
MIIKHRYRTISNLPLTNVQAGGIKEKKYRNLFMDGSNLTH